MSGWQPFPHDNSGFKYPGKKLMANWADLHRGDRSLYPNSDWVDTMLARNPEAAPSSYNGDSEALADRLAESWRDFHAGNFGKAILSWAACGCLAHAPANKAAGIYASYLEQDENRQRELFQAAAQRAEKAIELLPDDANSHYFHAFNLGRYSQSISVATALRQGIGGKIKNSLDRALLLQPDHAEAHTALGMYHAEIVSKIGKMVAKVTYGANAEQGIEHFERALELTPLSPIAHMEYGNGLYLLFGEKKLDEVTDLYVKASELHPRDAMEYLDIARAAAELE